MDQIRKYNLIPIIVYAILAGVLVSGIFLCFRYIYAENVDEIKSTDYYISGKRQKDTFFKHDASVVRIIYYGVNGVKKIREEIYDGNDTVQSTIFYTLYRKNKKVREEFYSEDKITRKIVFYDTDGKTVQSIHRFNDYGKRQFITFYIGKKKQREEWFDDYGKLMSVTLYQKDGKTKGLETFYNEEGRPYKYTSYDKKGDVVHKTKTKTGGK